MHPFAPLIAEEFTLGSRLIRDSQRELFENGAKFNSITLKEPNKRAYLEWRDSAGSTPPRMAEIVLTCKGATYHAIAQLAPEQRCMSFVKVEGMLQASIAPEEYVLAEQLSAFQLQRRRSVVKSFAKHRIALKDPEILKIVHDKGLNISQVFADGWTIGGHREKYNGKRVVQLFTYYSRTGHEDENFYAHPLDFWPVVDVQEKKVVEIQWLPEAMVQPQPVLATRSAEYAASLMPSFNASLKPIHITQPEGPSFVVDGHSISWYKFKFNFSFNFREGLAFHDIRWHENDSDKAGRRILYRASIAEMVVPYGDPRGPYHTKNAFDAGEDGLGNGATSLTLGCDCLGEIVYADGILNDMEGQPLLMKNVICIHEEDQGILWKHTNYRTQKGETRRNRRLVVSSFTTISNYDYGFYWYFYLDGTIQCEIKATGCLSIVPMTPGSRSANGIPLHDIFTGHHQHIFCARLDWSVDGDVNCLSEVEAVPMGRVAENPFGNGFVGLEAPLKTELAAKRDAAIGTGRAWKIYNPSKKNPLSGHPVAWKLIPTHPITLMCTPESEIARRAAFTTSTLWATPFNEQERFPTGEYPNQNPGGKDGIQVWTKRDASLENTNIVIWHTFGLVHLPKPEDWPIMPVELCGFTVKPHGFFSGTPTLDIPPTHLKHCKL
ncbi:primary-amine oxidase [Synchytrium microbalum]|uniref:Amine oxidase n=1 Tax=Synchytrium microbalum TaxID=1806994 RepID=A0A507CJ68_9FUNG|nr:primary-amine oxidase [Synchytrium microbalum]TPX38234.1 primary-amine oxidase [Synchytrium microbalum]